MASRKASIPVVAGIIILGYHLLAAAADGEQFAVNWRRFNQNPTFNNFLRVLFAEGFLIEDLGLGA